MPPTIRPSERQLEPQHIKLLTLIAAGNSEEGEGSPVHQNELEAAMKPDPHMYPIEQMVDYGLIENPDPTMKRHWMLTRRGEQALAQAARAEAQEASKRKEALKPKAPKADTEPKPPAAPRTSRQVQRPNRPPQTPARTPDQVVEA